MTKLEVGDTVIAGTTDDDRDAGTVVQMEGNLAVVLWDSGVRTWQSTEVLLELDLAARKRSCDLMTEQAQELGMYDDK